MSVARPGSAGASRTCPHCKATVLVSANVCPACRHHLRFNTGQSEPEPERIKALSVEGTVAVPSTQGQCEYCVVVSITNSRGEKVARQVVGVGVLQPGEPHSYSFSVDLMPVKTSAERKRP
ncbi:MAG: hypothetical protein ACHQIL_06575 [Steroidobacterales bacterium]